MFTGIIQEVGRVNSAITSGGNMVLDIEAGKIAHKLDIGSSVSINGACQTVVMHNREHFKVEAIKETLIRTNLSELKSSSYVNLELPLSLGDLLHGHLVQGHVDCVAAIMEIRPIEGSTLISCSYPSQFSKYLIEKGSIAIDGVSLTVSQSRPGAFGISLIPHTLENTTFRYRKVGDKVNLEFDMIAKYIEKMISPGDSKISIDFLKAHGF